MNLITAITKRAAMQEGSRPFQTVHRRYNLQTLPCRMFVVIMCLLVLGSKAFPIRIEYYRRRWLWMCDKVQDWAQVYFGSLNEDE